MGIYKIFNRLLRSEFIKNTSTLVTGTVIAQLIPILIQPFLRRYYSTEIFGAYAVYMSLIGIFYGVASFRYEQAIILPKDDKEAINIMFLAQILNLLFSIFIAGLIIFFKAYILKFINLSEEYVIFLLFVPIGTFLFNMFQSINLWLIRKKSFITVSKNKLVRRSSEGVFQLVFRYLKYSNGLIIGDFLGHIMNIIYGIIQINRNGFNIKYFKHSLVKYVLFKYSDYPKFNTLTTFLNACSLLLPVIIINKYFGSDYAGYYDLSRLILLTPIALLASSISNVMLQRISEKNKNKEPFTKELQLIFLIGVFIAIFEVFIIMIYGKPLFSLLFGNKWEYSGVISKLLIWPYLIYFFTVTYTSIFLSLRKIKELSLYQITNFLLTISLLLFRNQSFQAFLKAFVVINIIGALLFLFLLMKIIFVYRSRITSQTL